MISRRSALRLLALIAPAAAGSALLAKSGPNAAAPAELESHPVAVIPKGETWAFFDDMVAWAVNDGPAPVLMMSDRWPATEGWQLKAIPIERGTLIRAIRDPRA